jgi:hypothetical protein
MYDLKQKAINTNALNVLLRSFTPLCFLRVLTTDVQSITLDSNPIVGIGRKLQKVALEE